MTATMRARRARKRHRCTGGYGHDIQPGAIYVVHTQYPGNSDSTYANAAGYPVRLNECRDCARRYGRGHLIVESETNHR